MWEAYEQFQGLFLYVKNPDAFLGLFLRGDQVIKVFDRELNRVFALTRDQIECYISLHGTSELLLMRETVADLHDGPLAKHEGLAPYVERSEFERLISTWLGDEQPQPQAAIVNGENQQSTYARVISKRSGGPSAEQARYSQGSTQSF